MDKKIIHGVEVSDVHVELNDAPVTSSVWFKVNGFQTVEWLKKTNDGAFWVEPCDSTIEWLKKADNAKFWVRSDSWKVINEHSTLVAVTGLDEDVYDEFLDELHDYLDEIVLEQSQEAMSNDPACYELRYCEYGNMPHVGCTGSAFDMCVSCAQEIEELEFLMREQSPLRRERYYIAQCVTHEVLKRF